MSINLRKMNIGGLEVNVIRKDIKNIHLGIYPPNGRIRIAAPLNTTDEKVRLFIISRIPWIKKQQNKFHDQPRQTKREYVSGESHYFLGNRYLLNVIPATTSPKIEIKNKTHIDRYIRPETTTRKREEIVSNSFWNCDLSLRNICKF